MYQQTVYCCFIRYCKFFWSLWLSIGHSGETCLVVASVRGRTLFPTVMLLVWITSVYFLSEASHKKLIPLSVFHLHWTENIGFVLCNHKCFETCLIEMLYLLFCRVFSSRNHRGNLDSELAYCFLSTLEITLSKRNEICWLSGSETVSSGRGLGGRVRNLLGLLLWLCGWIFSSCNGFPGSA